MREYKDYPIGLIAPPSNAKAITPSDTVNLDFVARGIYVGTGGDVRVLMLSEDDIIFNDVPSGFYMIGQFIRVFDSSTTASNMVALA